MDGGIRRGADVVKAFALSASTRCGRASGALGARRRRWGRRQANARDVALGARPALALCGGGVPRDRSRDFVRLRARWNSARYCDRIAVAVTSATTPHCCSHCSFACACKIFTAI